MTEVLYGLDSDERERVAALRADGRFLWLDVSLREASRDDLAEALAIPERALRALSAPGDGDITRAWHADDESVAFPLDGYVESDTNVD